MESLEDRLTLSVTPVPDTTQYPWSAVVHIEAHFPTQKANEFDEGTGVLIDSFHVLTAGHLLYSSAEGGWADRVLVFAGQNGQTYKPFGVAYGTEERAFSNFIANDNSGVYDGHGDLGLLSLDRTLGGSTGWLGYAYNNGFFFNGLSFNTAGYPAEQGYSGFAQYYEYGPITGLSPDGALIDWPYSSITAIPGQSGSPLWVYDPTSGQRTVYGILVSGDDQARIGYGMRLTQGIYDDLQSWTSQDPNPGTSGSSVLPTISHQSYTLPAATSGSEPSAAVNAGNVIGAVVPPSGGLGIGAFDRNTGTWYLRSEESAGGPDNGQFQYGAPGWIGLTGDWNGDGQDSVGAYDPATATWYLRNENSPGAADAGVFQFGAPGWIPIVGDWNGDGSTTIGVYDPNTSTFYLRNEDSAGAPDAGQFTYGAPGWLPVTGSWDGGPATHIGVFDPSTANWYLRNEDSAGAPDAGQFAYGAPGWTPITGRWDGGSATTIGVVDPSTTTWYLRNSNSAGGPTTPTFPYGLAGWIPVVGAWGNTPDTPRSALGHKPASALASVGLFSADASAGGATPAAAVPQGGTGQGGLVAVREDDLRALARRWAVRRLHPAQDGLTSEEVADSVFTELARSSA